MSLPRSLLQHHFKTGLVLGKREGRGWRWPGSTGFPFSEFAGKVLSGGKFPNLEPAQRPWAAQQFLPLSSLLSQEQHHPRPGKGAVAGRGTVTFEFCSSPQLVGAVCYSEIFPPISMSSQASTSPPVAPALLHPRHQPKNSPVLPHSPPCAPRITQTSRVRLSPSILPFQS